MNKFILSGYRKYFTLTINQRINERQERNALNINHLFATVIRQNDYKATYPKLNTGIYHHVGKKHSQYPKTL